MGGKSKRAVSTNTQAGVEFCSRRLPERLGRHSCSGRASPAEVSRMLVTAVYWLFILLTVAGKLVAFVALVVFAIALPLTRIQVAKARHDADLGHVLATN